METVEEGKALIPLTTMGTPPKASKEDASSRAGKSRRPAQNIHSKFQKGGYLVAKGPFIHAKVPTPVGPENEQTLPSSSLLPEKEPEKPSVKYLTDPSKVMKIDPSPTTMMEKVQTPIPSPKSSPDASEVMKADPILKSSTNNGEMPLPPASHREEVASDGPIAVKPTAEKAPNLSADVLTHFNLGIHFYQQKEILKAIQSYLKVMELDPNYVEAYNNLGIIYQEMGELEKALEAYQKSVEINPRYEKAYNNRGIVFYLQGRHEEALGSFQKALALNPHNIESHINMGIVFNNQGQVGKAIESYQKALAINPLHGETHYNIGLLYEQIESIDLAIRHYHKFIRLCSPTHPNLTLKMQRRLNYLLVNKGNKKK
jgi:type IV pilus biogenesis/stability protein PilW